MESGLRLLGGANATGAIAGGVAFHAFESSLEIERSKISGSFISVRDFYFHYRVYGFVRSYR